VVFFAVNLAAETTTMKLSEADSTIGAIGMAILREAYGRLGIKVETMGLPAERALVMANAGTTDGVVIRIAGIDRDYPNLVMVPVLLLQLEAVVFTHTVDFPVKGWESLKPWRIGIIRGFKFAEQGTAGMRVLLTQNPEILFRNLERGYYDIAINERYSGLVACKQAGIENVRILEPPLEQLPMYHYVHASHRDLVPRLTAILQEMKASGRSAQLMEETVKKIMDGLTPD
jgi:polar amino acid transport system substrate-binding protein